MNESIIPGIVIGVIVAVAVGCVSHVLRKREMQDLWAEEERRRKSDRRREIYERQLGIVSDAMDAVMEAMIGSVWETELGSRVQVVREAHRMMWKAGLVTGSLKDQKLIERFEQLRSYFTAWRGLFDYETRQVKEGKEEEFGQLSYQVREAASEVLSRIREILEKA